MFVTYDKVKWHIDSGENEKEVIKRFVKIFVFLAKYDLLSAEGIELIEEGIDDNSYINEDVVNEKGKDFLDQKYDIVYELDNSNLYKLLCQIYEDYLKNR